MKSILIIIVVVVCVAVAALGGGLWYWLSQEEPEPGSDITRTVVLAMIKGATAGTWYLKKAADIPADALLADLIADKARRAGKPSMQSAGSALLADKPAPMSAAPAAALDGLAERAGHTLPAELLAILRTPGAIEALGWTGIEAMDTARQVYGDRLPGKFRASPANWAQFRISLDSSDGLMRRVPAVALERYIVLADGGIGGALLYDPAEPPAHPCCRVIEISVLSSMNPDTYRSLADYLRWEWAMMKAR